ncbi:MAG TPA: TRIC cation channel family protein [Trebonia sp.]|nr:TRIC cation channel family protein [Trebonia sp.]
MQSDLLTSVLDLLGVFANGLLGGAVARSQSMDLFGFAAMGLISGLGGGIIRDVLLQHGTPAALTHPAYIPTALAGAGIAFVMRIEHRAWDRLFLLVDAAAISLWASAGALKTLADGLGWLPAVLLGTITAIGGGVTREVILQRVPAVFTQGPLYATVAIFVAAITVVCAKTIGPNDTIGTTIAILAGVSLRIVAHRRGWRLPQGLEWQPRRLAQRRGEEEPGA